MKIKSILFLLIATISFAKAQYDPLALQPEIGWDSLKSQIVYPEIAKRAGVQGNVDVAVEFDSINNVKDIQIIGYEIFHAPIKDVVKKVRWIKKLKNEYPKEEVVYFTVVFKLKQFEVPSRNILFIEQEKPPVKYDH